MTFYRKVIVNKQTNRVIIPVVSHFKIFTVINSFLPGSGSGSFWFLPGSRSSVLKFTLDPDP